MSDDYREKIDEISHFHKDEESIFVFFNPGLPLVTLSCKSYRELFMCVLTISAT
jgi:hypothetical protein